MFRKRNLLLFLATIIFIALFACYPVETTAVPSPKPTPTPDYYLWQPGQSGYFLCAGGWIEEFYGQSFYQECLPYSGRDPVPVTPEPGHYLWTAGQRGYFLCENVWYGENYGQSVYRLCPVGDENEK